MAFRRRSPREHGDAPGHSETMTETHESERAGDAVLLEVGLTGGIASGKSTVDSMLENLGARIIDADAIVHRLLA